MQSVIDDFNQRKSEIGKYFEFIERLDVDYKFLRTANPEDAPYNIDDEHIKIFKANGFLILYNLIESTITNCIISIFDEIATKQIDNRNINYVDVIEKIRRYWLKNKYNHDPNIKEETVVNQFYLICQEVTTNISFAITSNKLGLGGSLDAKKIKSIADSLGVVLSEPHYKPHLHGRVFLQIKTYRNELAHGEKSFSAIGRDVTYIGDGSDGTRGLGLVHFKDYTIEHLDSFIGNISSFITNENYLFVQPV